MYYCNDCGREFTCAAQFKETHGFSNPPFEKVSCCPFCGSTEIEEAPPVYCKCCGAKITGKGDYCSDSCRAKGEAMRRRELKRRRALYFSALYETVRKADIYNNQHGTNYTYGQFVAYIEPKLGRKRK